VSFTQQKTIRNHIIKIRVNPDELAAIRARAGDSATAEWLRNLALDSPATAQRPSRHRASVHVKASPEAAALTREIARIGNNLNQLGRAVNYSCRDQAPINLLMVSAQLVAIWKELENVQQGV
jgi:hypothetical protein